MALTDREILRFDGPSIWGETDCIAWLSTITDHRIERSFWDRSRSEARALAVCRQLHGSYLAAVRNGLEPYGYREIDGADDFQPGDVVFVRHPVYGPLPAGVAPGPVLYVRHPYGVTTAEGPVLCHLRHQPRVI